MRLEKSKAVERSVDSIAKIYAIVIGLALSEAVKTLIVKDSNGNLDLSWATFWTGAPTFVAFVFTLVPFWHGMNRHLDRCYLEKAGIVAQGALLLDFFVFFIEASLLLLSGWALRSGLVTFYCLGWILFVDMIWGFISHQIHFAGQKSHVKSWIVINLVAGFLSLLVITFNFNPKPPVLMAIAIIRSIVDYWTGWEFYFPEAQQTAASPAGAQQQSSFDGNSP